MDNRRTETARENDDSEMIDAIEPTPHQEGRSGGNLQTDVGTKTSLERVRDPEAHEGVEKQDEIDHAEHYPGRNIQGSSDGGGSD